MKREDWTITETSARPMGNQDECFYCKTRIGKQHKEDCVIRSKTMVMNFTIRTVISVPEFWDDDQIEFHYNNGSWCADNLLRELQARSDDSRCMCGITEAKVIRDANSEDEEEYGMCFVSELES